MSWYKWIGRTAQSQRVVGITIASSLDEIERKLMQKHINLIYASHCTSPTKRIPRAVKSSVCHTLSNLLEAGIQLKEALELAGQTISHPHCKAILEEAAEQLEAGRELSTTLETYRHLFDEAMITLIAAGESSGALDAALKTLIHFYHMQENFIKKTKAALLLPSITFSIFIMITLLLFLFFIPRFENLFLSAEKPIPWYTQTLFSVSHMLPSLYSLSFITSLAGIILAHILRARAAYRHVEALLFRMPLIHSFIWYYELSFFFQTLGILLSKDVHLVTAFTVALKAIRSRTIRLRLKKILHDIESGQDLAATWKTHLHFLPPQIHALLTLGQKTGNLATMVIKVAQWTTEHVQHMLGLLQTYIPLITLFLLALLIGSLIIIVYVPLLTLSNTFV